MPARRAVPIRSPTSSSVGRGTRSRQTTRRACACVAGPPDIHSDPPLGLVRLRPRRHCPRRPICRSPQRRRRPPRARRRLPSPSRCARPQRLIAHRRRLGCPATRKRISCPKTDGQTITMTMMDAVPPKDPRWHRRHCRVPVLRDPPPPHCRISPNRHLKRVGVARAHPAPASLTVPATGRARRRSGALQSDDARQATGDRQRRSRSRRQWRSNGRTTPPWWRVL